jgi:flagellin-like protein
VSRRAVAPVIGVVLFVAVTVVLAAVVGAFAIGVGDAGNAPEAAITADRNGNEINLTHHSGDPLDVNELTIRIFIDGEPLEKQPDVPAYGSDGFNDLSGAFHAWGTQPWKAGATASLKIAGNNAPQPSAGSQVTVKIYSEGEAVATARA